MEPVQPANSEWTAYGEVPIGARRSELRFRVRAEQAPLRLSILVSGECWKPPLSIDRRLDPGEASAEFRLPIPGTGAFRLRTTVVALAADEGGRVRWEQARALSWGAAATPTPPPRPARVLPPRDLFLIVLDAARADHLGVYGYPRRTSPWIDALAREGFVVELARAPAPYTQASTASLMTGLEPETHDVRAVRSRLSDRAVTLAEALASAGYSTSALVGNANADRPFGFAQGFELFAGGRHDRALSRLEERLKSHERNFFYIHLFPPHHPYLPPPPFGGVYSRLFPGLVNGTSEELVRIRRSGRPPPAEEVSRLIAQYDENLLYADHLLGEILGVAARLGRLRDALVILLADHGEAFFERGTPLHGYSVHDEEIRIPMILRPPHASGLAPRVLSALAGTEDVLPTVLDLCGVPDPAPLRHGRSLLPLLQGRGSGEPDAYARAQGAQLIAALAGPRWKLHHLESRVALYDLAVDPGERHDLAEERPILAGLLRQRLIERTIRNLADGQASGLREDAVLDEETTRQLRALGYLD
jgi:arylsulfatase A-like enzyme